MACVTRESNNENFFSLLKLKSSTAHIGAHQKDSRINKASSVTVDRVYEGGQPSLKREIIIKKIGTEMCV